MLAADGAAGSVHFEIVSELRDVRVIARGPSLRRRHAIAARFGTGDWRKMAGAAWIRLPGGQTVLAELHWYEAHGIGRRAFKIKRLLEQR